eukprot:14274897-Heterocapsa_arctica.AAC.1
MDFRWKGAIARHRGFRACGRPRRCENTTKTTTPEAGGPWGAAGGGAVFVLFVVVFSQSFGRPCARNPLLRVIAPPHLAR